MTTVAAVFIQWHAVILVNLHNSSTRLILSLFPILLRWKLRLKDINIYVINIVLPMCCVLTHLISTTVIGSGYYFYPYIIDGETAQSG